MNEKKKISDGYMSILRLRTLPVEVKILEKKENLPSNFEIPDQPYTFCQFVTLGRVYARTTGVTNENLVCTIAKAFLGFVDFPKDLAQRLAFVRTSTAEAFEKILQSGLRLKPGKTQAALVAPYGGDVRRSGCAPPLWRWSADDPPNLLRHL